MQTVNSKVLRFVKGNQLVMVDEVLIGMTPLDDEELAHAQKFEFVDLYEVELMGSSDVYMYDDDYQLAMFDTFWKGVLVYKGDLGKDLDLYDWDSVKIYRIVGRN